MKDTINRKMLEEIGAIWNMLTPDARQSVLDYASGMARMAQIKSGKAFADRVEDAAANEKPEE